MLFFLFATLSLAKINIRTWLTWLPARSCGENGGQVLVHLDPFLPWNMSTEKRREMAIDAHDSS